MSDTLRAHPAGYSIQDDMFEYYSTALTPGLSDRQQREKDPKAIRVLFLGNSSTGTSNMPEMFHDLMVSRHHPCVVGMITEGGANLSDLWNDSVPIRAIRDFPWDYVVLQERETDDSVHFLVYARKFDQAIAATHARPLLFTQYYQNRFEQDNVDAQNAAVARTLQIRIIPISTVWDAALRVDPPLVADLFKEDGFHPTPHGAYLNALLLYRMITGHSPLGLPHHAGRQVIPDRIADRLQRAAATTVLPPAPLPAHIGAGPVLTLATLTRLATFATHFRQEPDSIRVIGAQFTPAPGSIQSVDHETTRESMTWYVGREQESYTVVDMVVLAGTFPTVAADLAQAGLTAQQWEEDRLALYSACMPLEWSWLGAKGEVMTLPETAVLRKNMHFLETHPQALKALRAAGMRCPDRK